MQEKVREKIDLEKKRGRRLSEKAALKLCFTGESLSRFSNL